MGKVPASLKAYQFKPGGGRVGAAGKATKAAPKATTKPAPKATTKVAAKSSGSMPPALKAYWAKKRGGK